MQPSNGLTRCEICRDVVELGGRALFTHMRGHHGVVELLRYLCRGVPTLIWLTLLTSAVWASAAIADIVQMIANR